MIPMAGSRVIKTLEKIKCGNVEEAWLMGEPIDDGVAKCDWLEAVFNDIPRLRENSGLLIVKTGEGITCFEDTKSNRREWLNVICRAIVQTPNVTMVDDDWPGYGDMPGYYTDQESAYFKDLDRPVTPEPVPAGLARRNG